MGECRSTREYGTSFCPRYLPVLGATTRRGKNAAVHELDPRAHITGMTPQTTENGASDGAPMSDGSAARAITPRQNLGDSSPVSGALLGYARVSTSDQVLDRQVDALTAAGCTEIFTDVASGSKVNRPGLAALLAYARPGDAIVIQALDRLGRTTIDLLALVQELTARDVGLRILTLGVDTRTPAGQLVLTVMAALAQMERDILRERTVDGLAAAKARGRVGGRPRTMTDAQVEAATEWRDAGKSVREIARLLGAPETTVRRRLASEHKNDGVVG